MRVSVEDAEQLDQLAGKMEEAAQQVDAESAKVGDQLGQLGDSWKDASYSSFTGKYESSSKVIAQFTTRANELVEYLREHARKIREIDDISI